MPTHPLKTTGIAFHHKGW
jgi:hypothetical protein